MKNRLFPSLVLLLTLAACSPSGKPALPGSGSGSLASAESFESILARAEAGDKDAQFEAGAIYFEGLSGVPKDTKTAQSWFEKSAAQGDEHAQFNLGVIYYSGTDAKQDFEKARGWFEKAAAQQNARAQFNLGVMYYRGEGVKQDYAQALEYFSEAGAQGFNEAAFNLGVMYAKGEGVTVDIGKAYAWFSAAKTYGNERAQEVIDNIENGLTAEQLKEVKKLADELKAMIDKNISAMRLKATQSAASK